MSRAHEGKVMVRLTEWADANAVYKFQTRTQAWDFMRACDEAKLMAGFPGLIAFTVEVYVPTAFERAAADLLATTVFQ